MSFLLNASKIWPFSPDESTQFVRVKNNVANITNRKILIRRELAQPHEDGMYLIGAYGGELRKVKPTGDWNYPDVDLLEPNFQNLKPYSSLSVDVRNAMMPFLKAAYDSSGMLNLGMEKAYQNGYNELPLQFDYPFKVSPEFCVHAKYLEIIFQTFRDIPQLLITKEDRDGAPLIIGVNWKTCALVSTSRSRYGQYV
jgi:hypothetical protein